jgi:hypothetical protein
MAKQTNFSFTNTTVNENCNLEIYNLGLTENYAVTVHEPSEVVIDNLTADIDQTELLTFRHRAIPQVQSQIKNLYPPAVKDGVQFIVTADELLSTRDPETGLRVDYPIVAYLTVRMPKAGDITSDHVNQVVGRCLGACYNADGTPKWNEFMRSALTPTE